MKFRRFLSITLVLALIFSVIPSNFIAYSDDEINIDDGLLAYYDFEGEDEKPTVIKDKSGNGNDADVVNNKETWGDYTVADNYLTVSDGVANFPGCTDFWGAHLGATLRLPNDFNQGVTDFTYSAWIKADSSYTYNDGLTRFFDFGNIESGSKNSIFARYTPSSGLLRVQDRVSGSSNCYREDTLSDKPFTDAWGLFTVTFEYDGENYYKVKTYVNGVLQGNLAPDALFTRSLNDLGTLTDDSNGLFIGRTVWGAKNSNVSENPDFCGQMDEIRIYNRAISADEVMYLYDNTNPVGVVVLESYFVDDSVTKAGVAPSLPESVTLTFTSGYKMEEGVTWDAVSPSSYKKAGVFYVSGVSESGYDVQVRVVVTKNDVSVLDDGLVLYYSFDLDDENPDSIVDVSGNGNNASVDNYYEEVTSTSGGFGGPGGSSNSTTSATIDNKITITDGVANFPGAVLGSDVGLNGRNERSKYYRGAAIKLPNGANDSIEDFTYSAWIYADSSYRYSSSLQRLFDFGKNTSSNTNSIFFRYVPSSGNSRFQDRNIASSADDSSSYISAALSDKPFTDKWGMLTVTYEKSSDGYYVPTVYINGEVCEDFDTSITTLTRSLGDLGTLTDSTNGLWIGRTQWSNSDNPDFCGKMDEIRLYNRVLSEAEISELYRTKKPSDVEIDYDSMPQSVIYATEDTVVSTQDKDKNYSSDEYLVISSSSGEAYSAAGNTRYGFIRFGMNSTEITQAANAQRALLTLHCDRIDNSGDLKFYCYGLTGENDNWNVQTITMNNYQDQLGGEISNDGISTVGELLGEVDATGWSTDYDVQFDVTDFLTENAAYGVSFLVTASTCAGYFNSCETEEEEKRPKIIISSEGVPVTINRVTDSGDVISTSVVNAVEGERYEYNRLDYIITYNDSIYVFDEENSNLVTEEVNYGDVLNVVYKKAESVSANDVDIVTYVGKAPSLPKSVSVTADGVTALLSVTWDDIDSSLYAEKGSFITQGTITNSTVPVSAEVRVFPEYRGSVGGDLTINIYVDGELQESKAISAAYASTFTLSSSYERYNTIYILDLAEGAVSGIGQSTVMDTLDQVIDLYYVSNETVEGEISAKIKADNLDDNSYSLVINAEVLNTEENDAKVLMIVATYDEHGAVKSCSIEEAVAQAGMGESVTFTTKLPYDVTGEGNTVIYLWRDSLEPLCDEIDTSNLEVEDFLPEEVYAMMPTYDSAVATLRKANDYWQSTYAYNSQPNGVDKAFWDSAAYHTGNMEAYKLLGDEDYLAYSVNWANACNWKGNNYTGDASTWTWGYNQSQGSNAVLFGDWQICFQTFIDLYNLNLTDDNGDRIGDLSRVYEVMEYQVSTDTDSYWWWADALYMVMPVLSKMYVLTDDEIYLDKLYKYFKYAKELMYDGPGGIPSSADGYTTSAKLSSGASYTDPDNYAYLFFRDSGYVYPLKPNSGHETEKNFWARGDGWVFAGLAKVLSDMPEDYEHYDEFYSTYMEMAKAIIDCQTTDSEGRGFWTQSMLQNYPKGTNGNDWGYETSGTAFFTYGLFWGINNGLLDEETYLEAAVRAWGYLENVALQSNGKVGYVQQIGSNATQATPQSQTQNFGVGAFLLASCEAARWGEKNN